MKNQSLKNMKKLLLLLGTAVASTSMTLTAQTSQTIVYDGGTALLTKHLERQIGPGARYYRYRLTEAAHPLNINMVTVDMSNPYIRIETNLPNDLSQGTELLVKASQRHSGKNKHAFAAQNGNFWIVSTQPQYNAYLASTHGVNMRNGMMAIDATSVPHWWSAFSTRHQGIVGVTDDNGLFIDACDAIQTFTTAKLGTRTWINCNKGFKPGQTSLYTKCFGSTRQFLPLYADTPEQIQWNDLHYDIDETSDCTEVLLDLADGETWMSGKEIRFKVAEVRRSNGRGTLGTHDAALVSRGDELAVLECGDDLTVNYSFVFSRDGKDVIPPISNALGGNMMVMKDGEITPQDKWDSYNTMIYSRSAYGISKDNNTLYMIVIDKSTDSYGESYGCTTDQMCQIVRNLGVWNLINVDAGGSAELMVTDRIINTTTEGTPRAVGNGWMVFNTSDDTDTEIAQLEFNDVTLSAPAGAFYEPAVIAYNRYGTPLDWNYKDFTVTCDKAAGTGKGNMLVAATVPGKGTITVTSPDGVSVSKEIEIMSVQPQLHAQTIVVDLMHPYTLEPKADINGKTSYFDPSLFEWTCDNPEAATVDNSGTVHAVANGVAGLTGVMGDKTLSADILVQIPEQPVMPLDRTAWSGWTAKGNSGLKDVTLGENGTITYTYNAPRGKSEITLAKDITVYGLADSVTVEFESDLPVHATDIALRVAGDSRGSLKHEYGDGLMPGKSHTIGFKVSEIGDPADRSIYPLTFAQIKFSTNAKTEYKGAHTLKINAIKAHYTTNAGVSDIVAEPRARLAVSPAMAVPGEKVTVSAAALQTVTVYTLSGIAVCATAADGDTASVTAPAVAGLYLIRATTRSGASATARLLVR